MQCQHLFNYLYINLAMIRQTPKELLTKQLITSEQFEKIDVIVSGKLVSVFYELRTLLYLGILLFTTGVGILIYENIGDIGHIISVTLLGLAAAACYWYVSKFAIPYSNAEIKSPTPYYDYIVLLGSLLLISVIGYLEFLYGFFEERPGLITLVTSALFFFIAYRHDHVGVLSLAITALASFWSISISPQKWYEGDFYSLENLYVTGLIFSTVLSGLALIMDRKNIKQHFTFTYLNFCSLIFFISAITGLFESEWWGIYLLLIYGGCAFAYYMARWKKSFLFMLYAFVSAYIGTTFLLAETIMEDAIELWFLYSIISCGGFIYFIVKYRTHFKQSS
jgi:hypothetical protein